MKILLTGAHGFIGARLVDALLADGHHLTCVVRTIHAHDLSSARARYVPADIARLGHAEDWMPLLAGVQTAINTVGIFREAGADRYAALHEDAAIALFTAARRSGARVIHFSALGADADAQSAFHRSKRAADDALRALGPPGFIAQPSLVYGAGGASAALFNGLAALPLAPLPGGGRQRIQPIHVDDVVAAVRAMLRHPAQATVTVPLCGPQAVTLRDYLATLRQGLGFMSRQRILPIPAPLAGLVAAAGTRIPGALLHADSLAMLNRGNTGDPAALTELLGRPPRPPAAFVAGHEREPLRAQAIMRNMLPALRLSLALVWLWTAAVSLGLYPVRDSLDLLRQAGVPAMLAPVALYGAAALDLLLGALTLASPRPARRWVWLGQMILVLLYSAIITLRLPEQWLHPFGPMSKNLPILALLALLYLWDSPQGKR
ncbi:SDR family oxidoreductase [Achromobacter xylosoxidans]